MQERLLDNIDSERSRTCTQYFMVILQTMKHPKVVTIMFNFMFGFSSEDLSDTDDSTYNFDFDKSQK